MTISHKCEYALRAVLELAKRHGSGPTCIREIAKVQAIPPKFLELILGELRKGGFVESRRGARGGYSLASPPGSISAGDVIRFIEGPIAPVSCKGQKRGAQCRLPEGCALVDMWTRARDAVAEVYDSTSLASLVEAERAASQEYVASYCI